MSKWGGNYRHAKSPEHYLEQRVAHDFYTGCINWVKGVDKNGYGQCQASFWGRKLKVSRAHQMAYVIENGPVPEGHIVCHTCDNTSCCNSQHLYAGTWESNVRDCVSRGRWKGGAKRKHDDSVIVELHGKMPCEDASKLLGISGSRVCQVWREYGLTGKRWHRGKNCSI